MTLLPPAGDCFSPVLYHQIVDVTHALIAFNGTVNERHFFTFQPEYSPEIKESLTVTFHCSRTRPWTAALSDGFPY